MLNFNFSALFKSPAIFFTIFAILFLSITVISLVWGDKIIDKIAEKRKAKKEKHLNDSQK